MCESLGCPLNWLSIGLEIEVHGYQGEWVLARSKDGVAEEYDSVDSQCFGFEICALGQIVAKRDFGKVSGVGQDQSDSRGRFLEVGSFHEQEKGGYDCYGEGQGGTKEVFGGGLGS